MYSGGRGSPPPRLRAPPASRRHPPGKEAAAASPRQQQQREEEAKEEEKRRGARSSAWARGGGCSVLGAGSCTWGGRQPQPGSSDPQQSRRRHVATGALPGEGSSIQTLRSGKAEEDGAPRSSRPGAPVGPWGGSPPPDPAILRGTATEFKQKVAL